MTAEERYWRQVAVGDVAACWEWTGYRNRKGYGRMGVNGTPTLAHRFGWELVNDTIPALMTVDHLCRNTGCQNTGHMEIVTSGENVLRGSSPSAINARKSHCTNGHEFTPENTYLQPENGGTRRRCKRCQAEATRRWKAS